LRQFSPAVIVEYVDVIALRPSLPCTAADHPGAWRGLDHVDHPHACHLCGHGGRLHGNTISPVTFDVCPWPGHWSRTDGL